jgi:hypothetical protein
MLHANRTWVVTTEVEGVPREMAARILASKLTETTWCPCSGFRLEDYLFLNDSTGPDGAQEYAVIHEPTMKQVESITFGWCNQEEAEKYILQTLQGEFEPWSERLQEEHLRIQTPEEHREIYCSHCA